MDDIDQNVTDLSMNNNKILSLEAFQFQKFVSLMKLDLSYNDISNINETAFRGLHSLEVLLLNNNKLTKMPYLGDIANSIKTINLNGNTNIKTVNLSQVRMTMLIKLHLEKTGLTSMPVSISNAANLTKLDVRSNQISIIPERYFKPLAKLRSLWISNNSLTDFNVTYLTDGRGFPHLTQLRLSRNNLTIMPSTDQISNSLKYLRVASMSFGNITEDYFNNLRELIMLDLNEIDIHIFPQFNRNMSQLETLYLKRNKITYVAPNHFEHLPVLKTLQLHGNQLKYFEIPYPGLRCLENLYLGWNKLQKFPNITSSIKYMKHLHIQGNAIKEISMKTVYGDTHPDVTADSMVEFFTGYNEMDRHSIDDCLWSTMQNLEEVHIEKMDLNIFPNIQMLPKLTTLWAQRNSFQTMGSTSNLENSKTLTYINLTETDLSSVVNFVKLAETATSSQLTVSLQENNLNCSVGICWMKYMKR